MDLTSLRSRRTVLRGGAATGAAGLGVLSVVTLAQGAVAGMPTTSSRTALAAGTGCATLTQEETQGPFWVDEKLNRADVRPDSETGVVQGGVPLTLTLTLQDAGDSCAPQAGAYVDIWHANAQGAYSDVSGSGNPNNVGVDWLRGYQVSDAAGQVTFQTVWPGFYTGRTIHIHFRVRTSLSSSATVNFTSQLFFDENENAKVLATSAYQKSGSRTTNAQDNIYDASLLMPVTGSPSAGYAGSFTVNLDYDDATSTATATPSTHPDEVVTARVMRAEIIQGRRHRFVQIKVHNRERVTGKLRLVRHDDVLTMRIWGWLPKGTHTLRKRIPDSVSAGRARVVVNLADMAGNHKISRTPVRVPSLD